MLGGGVNIVLLLHVFYVSFKLGHYTCITEYMKLFETGKLLFILKQKVEYPCGIYKSQ